MKILYSLLIIIFLSCNTKTPYTEEKEKDTTITKSYIDPGPGYSQAVVTEANGIKTIYISGQVGSGPNFETQFRNSLDKLFKTLENAGATFDDVAKYNTYIVNYQPQHLDTFRTIRQELLGDTDMPASTLVGVEALGLPEWGVEIEAIAVIKSE